jgi:sugar lactone lactonase YvrE
VDVTQVGLLTGPISHHGERPLSDHRRERLLLVDMLAGCVVALAANGSTVRYPVGTVAAAVRLRAGGGYALALERGFALVGPEFEDLERLPDAFRGSGVRMNDWGCDPEGRFYCGTMAYDMRPGVGSLYRLDPGLTVSVVLTGVTVSNGIQWSLDGSLAYYSDTGRGRVDVFVADMDTGTLVNRSEFAVIDPDAGAPDGLTLDGGGGAWVALWRGSRIHRYDESGTLSDVLQLPVTNVTSCTLGGQDWRQLFITTSRLDVDPDEQPGAGAVFMAEPGVIGTQMPTFAG